MEKFNQLTPAEEERLAWLIEECSEVIKACTKIQRHGYYSYDPSNIHHLGNRADLETEIQDVLNQSEISTAIFEETADGFLEGVKDDLELLKGTYEELMEVAEDEGHKEIANYAQDQILDLAKSIWMLTATLS
jgi:NTP pyrophosphatase (non-canonical NTP hydrolase)